MVNVIMLMSHFVHGYAVCHFAECRYAECGGATGNCETQELFLDLLLGGFHDKRKEFCFRFRLGWFSIIDNLIIL
jgi:hypothetical protein